MGQCQCCEKKGNLGEGDLVVEEESENGEEWMEEGGTRSVVSSQSGKTSSRGKSPEESVGSSSKRPGSSKKVKAKAAVAAEPTRTVAEKFEMKMAEEKAAREEAEKKRKEASRTLRGLETKKAPPLMTQHVTPKAAVDENQVLNKRAPTTPQSIFKTGTAKYRKKTSEERAKKVLFQGATSEPVLHAAATRRASVGGGENWGRRPTLEVDRYELKRKPSEAPPMAVLPEIEFTPKRPARSFAIEDAEAAHTDMMHQVFDLSDTKKKGKLDADELGLIRQYLVEFTNPDNFAEIVSRHNVSKLLTDRGFGQASVKAGVDRKAEQVGAIHARAALLSLAKSEAKQVAYLDDDTLTECVDRVMMGAQFEVTKEEFHDLADKLFKICRTLCTAQYVAQQHKIW